MCSSGERAVIEFIFNKAKWSKDNEGFWVSFLIPEPESPAIKNFAENVNNRFTAVIKKYRHKRSNNANAYAWALMSEMAKALHVSKEEIYSEMLKRYGVFTHIIAKPQAAGRVKQEWRECEEIGEVTVNGFTGLQIRCYYGSSTYDTKEMSTFIDGIVSECQEMGIETLTPKELSLMKEEWGR